MDADEAGAAKESRFARSLLFDLTGPLDGARIIVIGDEALAVLCHSIRRGAAAACERRLSDRTDEVEPADIAIVPAVRSLIEAARAVRLARRSLVPRGRLVLRRLARDHDDDLVSLLHVWGFGRIRMVRDDGCVVVRADRAVLVPGTAKLYALGLHPQAGPSRGARIR